MSRSNVQASTNSPYAAGQQNYSYSVLFDENSTEHTSQVFDVVENFVRIAAFNLGAGDTLTIEQVTGQGAGDVISEYAPVNGPVVLYYNSPSDLRTSYVLERPGRYRVNHTGPGLGSFRVFQISYFMENEASQDLADALYAVLVQFKKIPNAGPGISIVVAGSTYTISNTGIITATPTATVTPVVTGTNLEENVNVSANFGNAVVIEPDGLYVPTTTDTLNPCDIGAIIPVSPTALPNYVGLNGSGCIADSPLISATAGNAVTLNSDGLYVPEGSLPDPCGLGGIIPDGVPVQLVGVDASGCLVAFSLVAGTGITITSSGNNLILTNTCCSGPGPGDFTANLCATTLPTNLSASCSAPDGSLTYEEVAKFTVGTITGGTGPYTIDFSNVTASATWSGVVGTPSLVITNDATSVTITAQLTSANHTTSGVFKLTIPNSAYITITDSTSASEKWYFHSLPSVGSCNQVNSPPGINLLYTNTISCTSTPCTMPAYPHALTTVEAHQTVPNVASVSNFLFEVGATADWVQFAGCGGDISFVTSAPTCTISDPLNTMGTGTTYHATVLSIGATSVTGTADAGSDWPSTSPPIQSSGSGMAFPCEASGDAKAHYPTAGANISTGYYINIPAPLNADGALHTITWTYSGGSTAYISSGNPHGYSFPGHGCGTTCTCAPYSCGCTQSEMWSANTVTAQFQSGAWV